MTPPPAVPYDPDRLARGAIIQFVGRCAVALLIVGIATFGVASKLSNQQAQHDAEVRGEMFTTAIAAPLVTSEVRAGQPAAVAGFAAIMTNRLKQGGISRINVWDTHGRIIWSNRPALMGTTSKLPDPVTEASKHDFTVSWKSEEAPDGDSLGEPGTLEVYAGTLGQDGKPVIVETYWTAKAIDSKYDSFLKRLAPLSLGALLLLMVAIVPLGMSLARRLARSTHERDRMLQHALRASDLERRRMTHTLHDGVIQDLAGLAYLLPSVTPADPRTPEEAELRSTLVEATQLIKSDVRQLRDILADLYPPSLDDEGLDAALGELADWAGRAGIDVTVSTRGTDGLEPAYARLAYRVVREGLLNVISHSGAEHALVWVRVTPLSGVEIAVRDDGKSAEPQTVKQQDGHFGLRLLRDVMADFGGELTVNHAPSGGTELRASLPSTDPEQATEYASSLIPGLAAGAAARYRRSVRCVPAWSWWCCSPESAGATPYAVARTTDATTTPLATVVAARRTGSTEPAAVGRGTRECAHTAAATSSSPPHTRSAVPTASGTRKPAGPSGIPTVRDTDQTATVAMLLSRITTARDRLHARSASTARALSSSTRPRKNTPAGAHSARCCPTTVAWMTAAPARVEATAHRATGPGMPTSSLSPFIWRSSLRTLVDSLDGGRLSRCPRRRAGSSSCRPAATAADPRRRPG